MAIKAVIFDLDDTLLDRSKSLLKYAEVFRKQFGAGLPEVSTQVVHKEMVAADNHGLRPKPAFMGDLLAKLSWTSKPEVSAMVVHFEAEFPESSVLAEDAETVLRDLKAQRIPIGLVTNGPTALQNRKIDCLAIRGYFKSVVVSETVGVRKPDARIFEIALNDLGSKASETVFIGDNPLNDVVGSANAGLAAVWFVGSVPWPDGVPAPKFKATRMADLSGIIRGI